MLYGITLLSIETIIIVLIILTCKLIDDVKERKNESTD